MNYHIVIPEKVDNLAPKIANLIRVLDIPSLDAGDSVHLDFSHTKFFSNELTASIVKSSATLFNRFLLAV